MSKEQFTADTGKVLNIVINSLYSDKDIFVRELISNSSDAIDKRRFMNLSESNKNSTQVTHSIQLEVSAKEQTLVFNDNGIGMDEADLKASLGTIAKSGTTEFLEQLEKAKKDESKSMNLIGQFGVGFYSAFMVAEKVEVKTLKQGSKKAFKWLSDGSSGYEISEDDKKVVGTTITLFIKKSEKEFLKKEKISSVVKKYSDHIQYPIEFVGGKAADKEVLNDASAIWTRAKGEITVEQNEEFFRQSGGGFGKPMLTLHNKTEGVISYTSLLYIPETRPFDLFHVDRSPKVKLYANRVFITDTLDTILPRWLRFIHGVLDTADLNLNVSREMLQHSPALSRISKTLKKKIISELKKKKDKEPEIFSSFWKEFGTVLKEGIYEDGDNKTAILELSKFESTRGSDPIFLNDYVEKMHKDQDSIFYIAAENMEQATKSPHLEVFTKKKLEVLFLTDPIDTFWLSNVPEFSGKKFVSVTQGAIDLSKFGETEEDSTTKKDDKNQEKLLERMKEVLGDEVSDVRISDKLVESACCLVASDTGMDIQMERIMKMQNKDFKGLPRVLEINPEHPLIKLISKDKNSDNDVFSDISFTLLDQAKLLEGHMPLDITAFCNRINKYLNKSLV
jgi:molecular chaperone HtpG